jgi:hypothetical protein
LLLFDEDPEDLAESYNAPVSFFSWGHC